MKDSFGDLGFEEQSIDELGFEETLPDVGQGESFIRGLGQGVSFGFADEIAGGLEALLSEKTYEQARNESRRAYADAQKANPITYGAGEIGGAIGTAFVPGLGALNAAKGARAATVIGKGALQGAITSAGLSEADNAKDLAIDTAIGAGVGGAAGAAGKYVLDPALDFVSKGVVQPLARQAGEVADVAMSPFYNPDGKFNKAVSKVGGLLTGVDDEAILRQIQRPAQTAVAEKSDEFAYNTGLKAVSHVDNVLHTRGTLVNKRGREFLKNRADESFSDPIKDIAGNISEFLEAHKPSPKGFSALSDDEISLLKEMKSKMGGDEFTGEDVFKFRQYLDFVERLAGKYDKEGKGPFVRFLKVLRGKVDGVLDGADRGLDYANLQYANAKRDVDLLRPFTDESRAEGLVNNLYGKNKTAKQKAAEHLFKDSRGQEILDSIKDISANKAFENAKGPAGSEFGLRQLGGALLTGGLSIPVTSPSAWKHGSRAFGRLQSTLSGNPERLGKYAKVLLDAAQRGNKALATTHFILQQRDPEYRKRIQELEKDQQ